MSTKIILLGASTSPHLTTKKPVKLTSAWSNAPVFAVAVWFQRGNLNRKIFPYLFSTLKHPLDVTLSKLIYLKENGRKPSPPQLVTSDDLEEFRLKLLMDIKRMLEGHLNKTNKRWLKSCEVKKML